MRASAFSAFSIVGPAKAFRRLVVENSYWKTWTGFLAQMVFFALLGVLSAFAVKDLLGG